MALVATGSGVAAAPKPESECQPVTQWVESLEHQRAKEVLQRLLVGDAAEEKARLLAEIRDSQTPVSWPTSDLQRSLEELLKQTETLRAEERVKQARKAQENAKRKAAKAERERVARLQEMRKDPDKWLSEAERLADARGTTNYKAAAEVLYDLREAVGGDEGDKITRRLAEKLAKKYPTLTHLKGSLRKRGLLD